MAVGAALAAAAAALAATGTAGADGAPNGNMCVLNTQLRAAPEVPASTSDASGRAQIKIRNDGTVRYKIMIRNPGDSSEREAFTMAHIHVAPPGEPGPVVVTLFSGEELTSRRIRQRGTVSASSDLAGEICGNPDAYYVNAHSTENPTGAIRGQL
ncbi:MAG: CHRD domain-containing protein [Thermoleophilia bacterium]|nr:CHRD domain-containing protein [Thermoleophilia bacterium]